MGPLAPVAANSIVENPFLGVGELVGLFHF
jgi:hypothetical protein